MTPLFRMRDVVKHYRTTRGMVHAVDGISFDIGPGEVLGLLGEVRLRKIFACTACDTHQRAQFWHH